MTIEDIPAGHVIHISEAAYLRLGSETQKNDVEQDDDGDVRAETLIGTHPQYGLISLSCVRCPAVHPERPSYILIITGQDEKIPFIRAELEVDDV